MKLLGYKEVLKLSKDKLNESLAPMRAKQASKLAELESLKIDEKILEIETKIQERCTEHPLNFDKVIDHLDEIALLERRKKQFSKIISELFDE